MGLPIHTRATALVVALSTTACIIVTIAEIGHPPADPQGLVAFLIGPGTAQAPVASVTHQPVEQLSASADMPQP